MQVSSSMWVMRSAMQPAGTKSEGPNLVLIRSFLCGNKQFSIVTTASKLGQTQNWSRKRSHTKLLRVVGCHLGIANASGDAAPFDVRSRRRSRRRAKRSTSIHRDPSYVPSAGEAAIALVRTAIRRQVGENMLSQRHSDSVNAERRPENLVDLQIRTVDMDDLLAWLRRVEEGLGASAVSPKCVSSAMMTAASRSRLVFDGAPMGFVSLPIGGDGRHRHFGLG